MYIYIYVCVCVYLCVCIYICVCVVYLYDILRSCSQRGDDSGEEAGHQTVLHFDKTSGSVPIGLLIFGKGMRLDETPNTSTTIMFHICIPDSSRCSQ